MEINLLTSVIDFKNTLSKRADTLYREANIEAEMQHYDKAYALKIRADEARLIEVDLNGYLQKFMVKGDLLPDEFGHNTNWKYCPGCRKEWEKDDESFGCSSCGYVRR